MANEFKIKHGFVSTGDGTVEGEIRVSGIAYAENGSRLATRAYLSQFLTDNNYVVTGDLPTNISAFTNDSGYLTEIIAHTHSAADITSGTLSNDRLSWNATDTFTGTYSLLWNASNALYTASWLQVRGSDDTLLTRNIVADGTVTGANLMVSNWNAAHGWGDHDGLYDTAGTGAAEAGTVNTRIDDEIIPLIDTKQPAGTYNTVIGTDSDINTSGSTIIDNIFVTDGVITSMGTRTLSPVDIGAATSGHNHDGVYFKYNSENSGFLNLGQNPVGTTYGDTVSTVPSYYFGQKVGDNDGWRLYGEAPASNDVKMIFEIIDDIEGGDTWVFRNKKTYDPWTANDVVKIGGEGNITTSGKLLIGTVDANTTSTTALVLNGTEVEKRTLGSNAFSSTAYDTLGSADAVNSRIDTEVLPSIPTNNNQLTNGAGYITDGNTGWNNTYGFITASSTNTLTNKSGNISQWTNDSGYITDGNTGWNNSYGFITASSTDTLTNKSGNISQWTNDSGYITDGNTGWNNTYGFITGLNWTDLGGDPADINLSQFTNDVGYITDGNQGWNNTYGFITASASITGNAATATKLATARNIALSGAVTGNANFDGSGNITIATTATSDPTLTLAGDASGSATFTNLGNATLTVTVADDSHNHVISNVDGLQTALDGKLSTGHDMSLTLSGDASGSATFTNMGNATLSVTVANDSHTHDGRYYTESESDARFVNVTGDNVTGDLSVSGASLSVTSTADGSEAFFVDGVNGRLFTITDSLSDSLFSVNTISGLPVIEAFSDNTVKLGPFSNPVTIDAAGVLAIGGVTAATQTYVDTAVNNIIGGAPGALDTLNELAAAINDDASFASSVTTSLSLKAPLASPALTGTPTAPTQATSNNSTRIATTAFVKAQGYVTTDTNYYLNGISRSGNVLTFSVNGATNQTYTFGSAAWAATTAFDAAGTGAAEAGAVNDRIDNEVLPAVGAITLSSLGYTGATNANYITNNNQLTNGAGYITGVSWAAVTGKPSTFTPSAHTHAISDVDGLQGELDAKQPAGSYAASNHNHTYDVNNSWLRENGDNANVKLFGNTRQMVFRTDGTTEYASGVGGYAFVWMYGGDAAGNRRMLLGSDGRIWSSYHGWLDTAFASASHNHDSQYDALGSAQAVNDRIDNDILPAIPSVPTNVSAFTNDAGYITDGNTNWNNSYGFITASSNITGNAATATSAGKLYGNGSIGAQPGTNNLLYTGQISTGTTGLFPAVDNSNSIITLNRHSGNYDSQLGFSSNGNIYYRKFSNSTAFTTQAWLQVWHSGNFANNSANWNTAYGWGNHAGLYDGAGEANAVNSRIDNEVLPLIQTPAITSNGSTPSLNTGISAAEVRSLIGAQASGTYLTSYSETDTLATVTSRGNTTSGAINVNGNILLTGSVTSTNQGRMIDFTGFDKEGTTDFSDRAYIQHTTATGGHSGSVLVISSQNDSGDGIAFLTNASSKLKHNSNNIATENWVSGLGYITEGVADSRYQPIGSYLTTSGKAADSNLLDGINSSSFVRSDANDTVTGVISFNAGINTLSINDTSGQQLVICAGEAGIDASQNGELVYVNAENGFQVAASNDNWASGYAGTKKTIIDYGGIRYDGNYVWHGGNFNPADYQPAGSYLTTTGKAADSNLLDGLDLHTGRNNEANKVVRTDGSGYLQAGWVNTTSGAAGTINKIYCSQDDYVRYLSPQNFRSQVTDGVYQPAGTYNTIIGTDSDINTSGSTIIDNIYVTDGVITSMGTRTLTAANLGIAKPAPPTFNAANIVGETIEVVFEQSGTSGVDSYQVWSSVNNGSYGLIANIPTQDIAATMTAIDAVFSISGDQAYRVYAIKNGIYSDPAEGSVAYTASGIDVVNMSVVNLNTAYYIQYDMPVSRFVDHIEIYMDAEASSGSLSRTGATLVYSGNNTNYMYQIAAADMNKFHQFWVEVIES